MSYTDNLSTPERFFPTYFASDSEALRFLEDAQKLKNEGNEVVSKLIESLHRFAVLALSIQSQTYSDGMYLFFMRICLETMAKIMEKEKVDVINLFYDECIDFKKIEERIKNVKIGEKKDSYELTRENLALFVRMVRNNIAHEGKCWVYSFTAELFPEIIRIQAKDLDREVLKKLKKVNGGKEVDQISFESALYRDDLTFISIQGFIKLIILYMNGDGSKKYSYSLRNYYSSQKEC